MNWESLCTATLEKPGKWKYYHIGYLLLWTIYPSKYQTGNLTYGGSDKAPQTQILYYTRKINNISTGTVK